MVSIKIAREDLKMTKLHAVYKKFTSNITIARLKVKRVKKKYCGNVNQKKVEVALLTLYNVDFGTKKTT